VIASATQRGLESNPREWVVAAAVFGLMTVLGVRQGGFWPGDAAVALFASALCLIGALVTNAPDRRSAMVVISLLALTMWWLLRAVTSGSGSEFLPLGASIVAFAAAFAAVRPLQGGSRALAGLGVACLGAAGASVGFAGLVWRWYPMAMPAQGLWRLSSTLTYSDATGLVLGVCLLLALGSDLYPWLTRVAVCLCAGGLLATQSRGAYIAFACACAIVPWRRYAQFLVPLVAGVVLGVSAIVTSPHVGPVPWLGIVFVVAVGGAALVRSDPRFLHLGMGGRVIAALLMLAGGAVTAFLVQHEFALRAFAPSDRDRSVEWSTALHQWRGAPFLGVGPDRLLVLHAIDGNYAHFVHNEYLQIAADSGAIGLVLLAISVGCVIRVVRRSDLLASCSLAALVCWAIAGAFDFDWHLTFVGLLGGWCVGLACRREQGNEERGEGDRRGRRVGRAVRDVISVGRGFDKPNSWIPEHGR
jgi:hypothetical protein